MLSTLSLSPAPSAATADYCRRARRLRARFANEPTRLQCALRELAHSPATPRHDPAEATVTHLTPATGYPPGPARIFSSRVAAALTDGVLRYSARQDLLREAARMGLGRFEATLLIAAVQHADRPRVTATRQTLSPQPFPSASLIALAAVTLQATIAGAIWWMLHA